MLTILADLTYCHLFAAQDCAAFSLLYDATPAKLLGVCLQVLNNRAESEDTLQDVFVNVWQKANLYSVNGYSPMPWLITLARNASIDRLCTRKAGTVDIDKVAELGTADISSFAVSSGM